MTNRTWVVLAGSAATLGLLFAAAAIDGWWPLLVSIATAALGWVLGVVTPAPATDDEDRIRTDQARETGIRVARGFHHAMRQHGLTEGQRRAIGASAYAIITLDQPDPGATP